MLLLASFAAAQENDFERSRVEVSADLWFMNTVGDFQSDGTLVNLKSDLGLEQGKLTPVFRLVLKPGRKHRLIFEGTPYRLDGFNQLNRAIVFEGTTYPFQDRIDSNVKLDYFHAGYQYDLVRRAQGHFGLQAGVAYVKASGSIRSAVTGISESAEQKLPLPTVGGEFRVFPIPGSRRISLNGELRGMSAGHYGHYLQYQAGAGLQVIGGLYVKGGYRSLEVDGHVDDTIFSPRFAGPVFSIEFRDR